jgi:hypothetical protein
MKVVRELENRIERKLYRQGKILGGVYVAVARRPSLSAVVSIFAQTTWFAPRTATWEHS